MRFQWDPKKNMANLKKHGVRFEEAMDIFLDASRVTKYDVMHSQYEDRWNVVGCARVRTLFVTVVEITDDIIRIISARKATTKEKEEYFGIRNL
jgi:uncharacterized DUF497 family protein